MNEIEFSDRLHQKIQTLSQADIGVLGPDTLLFSTGLVDSLTMVDIIVLVEEYWGIQVDPGDLSMDNFNSIASIASYVQRKRLSET